MLKLLSLFIAFLFPAGLIGQYAISGRLQLDSNWDNTIYLSLIPDLEDLYRCSEHLIIAKSVIGKEGDFVLRGNVFPDQAHLVRIHLSKKGDPPATLIIGGKDENHCFLALQRDSRLQLRQAVEGLFDHFSVEKDPQNKALFYIDSLRQYFTVIDTAFSSIDYKRMVQEEQAETLLAFADTSGFLLPALYAVHYADWGANRQEVREAGKRLARRFPPHPYLREQEGRSAVGAFRFSFWYLAPALLLAFMSGLALMARKRPPPALQELSVQERKILVYLYQGRSNKEIAGALHIEPSTVKSHVYSIYQKLSISSRKEVARFGRWIDRQGQT